MLKIEKIKIDDKDDVLINGQSSKNATLNHGALDLQKNLQDFERVTNYTFIELKDAGLQKVFGKKDRNADASIPSLVFTIFTNTPKLQNRIEIGVYFYFDSWKKQYSINEFTLILQNRLNNYPFLNSNTNIYLDDKPINLTLSLYNIIVKNLQDTDIPNNYIAPISKILEPLIIEIMEELDNKLQLDIYSTFFNFPSELKVACTQYLVYFVQFLIDLGIEVQTEIKDMPQGTFFSVIPQNKSEAISSIKQLLNDFMNAPGSAQFDIEVSSYQDIAAIQWQANILHLKSQISLANTQIQMKDAIIQMKEATINSLNLSIYQLSEKIVTSNKKDEEQIIDGILSVTTFEKFGGKLNLAELYRRLKRKF